jgi:hypothetical protein
MQDVDARLVRCQCTCGTERDFVRTSVRFGASRSCGCNARGKPKHGMSETPTYKVWSAMIARCGRSSHPQYGRYGLRGISVCSRWLEFEAFLLDMGEKPDGLTLDRINNDMGYEPGNCRWVSHRENCQNTSASRVWLVNGLEFSSCAEAAAALGVSPTTIHNWCHGYCVAGVSYPPKQGCSTRLKYT